MECYYRAKEPQVIYETMGDNEVVINLDSGCYYSLNPSAAYIWRGLINGNSSDIILATLRSSPSFDAVQGNLILNGFIKMLVEEDLIEPTEKSDLGRHDSMMAFAGLDFLPNFEKFTDMQEMLLLDPIHEVGEMGWPHPAQ